MTTPDQFDARVFENVALGDAAQRSAARLRSELRDETTRVVRTRRRIRRAATVCGFLACYAAGILTMQFLKPSFSEGKRYGPAAVVDKTPNAPGRTTEGEIDPPEETVKTSVRSTDRDDPEPPNTFVADTTPVSAVSSSPQRKSRYEALRELGDRYLLERQDPEGAVRAYRLALRSATPIERMLAQNEGTWLFRALTRDYEGEISDERHDG